MNKCICVNVNLLNLGVFYYIAVSAIVLHLTLSAQAVGADSPVVSVLIYSTTVLTATRV